MIAEHEKLPNITASASFRLGTTSGVQGAIQIYEATGAFGSQIDARTEVKAFTNAAFGSVSSQHVLQINAAATNGTGKNVYTNNAHVRPSSIALVYWKRFQ